MIVLETERLVLRPFAHGDLEAFARISADPEVMRHIGEGHPMTRAEAWRAMAVVLGHWHLRGYGIWAAAEKATGALVGRIGLWNPHGWPGLEVGWLLDRAVWGRGLATEGGRAALEHAFGPVGAERVISLIHPANAASVRVAEKLGATREGTARLQGRQVDVYAYEPASESERSGGETSRGPASESRPGPP